VGEFNPEAQRVESIDPQSNSHTRKSVTAAQKISTFQRRFGFV
jgi:hypothetical protein